VLNVYICSRKLKRNQKNVLDKKAVPFLQDRFPRVVLIARVLSTSGCDQPRTATGAQRNSGPVRPTTPWRAHHAPPPARHRDRLMVLAVAVPSARDHPLARAHDARGPRAGARASRPHHQTNSPCLKRRLLYSSARKRPPAVCPPSDWGRTNDMEETVELMLWCGHAVIASVHKRNGIVH
jgi:hypothetical protein